MTTTLSQNLEIKSVEKITDLIFMIFLNTLLPLSASCDTFEDFLSMKIAFYKQVFTTSPHCKTSCDKNALWWTTWSCLEQSFITYCFYIKLFSSEVNNVYKIFVIFKILLISSSLENTPNILLLKWFANVQAFVYGTHYFLMNYVSRFHISQGEEYLPKQRNPLQ